MLRIASADRVFRSFYPDAAKASPAMPAQLAADWASGVPLLELATFRRAVDRHYAAHPEHVACWKCKEHADESRCTECHTGLCRDCVDGLVRQGANPIDIFGRPGYVCIDCCRDADLDDDDHYTCDFCRRAVAAETKRYHCPKKGCVACFSCHHLGVMRVLEPCPKCE